MKMINRWVSLSLASIATTVFMVGCGPSNSATTSASPQAQSWPHIGQSHKVGKLDITVNSVKQAKEVGTASGIQKAHGVYWDVNVTVKDVGNSEQSVSSSMFQIINKSQSKSYNSDLGAAMYLSNPISFNSLNPGVSESGDLLFDMPSNISKSQIANYHLYVSTGLSGKQSFSFSK